MKKTYVMIFGISLVMIVTALGSSAWQSGGARGGSEFQEGGGFYHGNHGNYGWGVPYWYAAYTPVPCIGAFVAYLPDGYTKVLVDGSTYYYGGGYYLMPYSSGYMVVAGPPANAIIEVPTVLGPDQAQGPRSGTQPVQSKSTSHDTTTINVPNSKGGFTQVTLVKHKNGYVGPQGEFYDSHPTVDELKALYGN